MLACCLAFALNCLSCQEPFFRPLGLCIHTKCVGVKQRFPDVLSAMFGKCVLRLSHQIEPLTTCAPHELNEILESGFA